MMSIQNVKKSFKGKVVSNLAVIIHYNRIKGGIDLFDQLMLLWSYQEKREMLQGNII